MEEDVRCGGAEISFFSLCAALDGRCEVHLAIYRGSLDNSMIRRLFQSLEPTGIRVHWCETPLNPGTITNLHRALRSSAARELSALIEKIRPDVLIVNLPTVERGQAVVDAAERCNPKPPVWGFLHLSQPPSTIGAKLGVLRDLLVPRLLSRFDQLLTVSRDGAREISQRYHFAHPIVVRPPTDILTPLPAGADRSELRKGHGLPDTFLVGIVGRLELHHKGQDVALRVTRQLVLHGSTVHLVVVGDGPDRYTLERMAQRLDIISSVTFLGWREDIGSVIPLLDAVLIPSRYEGFPLTAVQAVTAYVPVIGYSVGGLPELLPDDFMVRPGDESGLVAAVTGVLRGARRWPAGEVALRAANWCRPEIAAGRVVRLLSGGPGARD
jgi:glycosyltransferase involved in cell wall biosynthesis